MNIYLITNKINGKQYIGQTTRSVQQRWDSHCSAARNGSPFRFHSAIRKYGEDAFIVETLFENLNDEYGRTIEEQLILEYKTMENGYNAKPGGCGGWIVKPENYDNWIKNLTVANTLDGNKRWSGYSDEFILDECAKIFNSYSDKNEFSFNTSLSILREKNKGIPKFFSKNRFKNYKGSTAYKRFKQGLSEKLNIPLETLIKYSNAKSATHKENLSKTNIGNKWYSNDKLQISKRFKNDEVPEGWTRGRKYGNKN